MYGDRTDGIVGSSTILLEVIDDNVRSREKQMILDEVHRDR